MPTEPKHTPGPWTVSVDRDANSVLVISPWSSEVRPSTTATFGDYRGAIVCKANFNSGVPSLEQAEANANLIAAAPDAARILDRLLEYVAAGEPLIYLDCLMPDDGYDGATDEQTLADAVRVYFAKTEGSNAHELDRR